ncbi:MAG: protein kinase domain-containing protein [Phyllobacteriaceae bacterium]|nr:protein kinase domain-containing protein [Phyllobacteriaceae bacterium]
MKTYRTGSGRTIRTAGILGKGGEGTIFQLEGEADLAAKIYTDGKHLDREKKIKGMVSQELHKRSKLVAFPVDTLMSDTGGFVGFLMRRIVGGKPTHELYAPGSRKLEFPQADFRFLALTATNVARAVADLHHNTNCIIGDINHSGILVGTNAIVTLIDADSFQFQCESTTHRCIVGTGEYTPPELQGVPLGEIDREHHHDAFGLAILVFQLLFMGRHPFAGRYSGPGDMPIERAIKEGRFAYSSRNTETKMEPPPFVPTLSDLPPDMTSAFERAFNANPSLYRSRPSPAEWVSVLSRFEAELIACRINPTHYHAKNASVCPWCRLESGMGVALFPASGAATAGASLRSNFDLTAAIAAIDRVLGPGPAPDALQVVPAPAGLSRSAAAGETHRGLMGRRIFGGLLAIGSIAVMTHGVPIAFLGLIFAAFLLFGGSDALNKLKAAKTQAERNWAQVAREWESEIGESRFDRKKSELRSLITEHKGLPGLEKLRLDDLERRRKEIQLQRFLEGHLIARAKIPGIGDGRKATLASYGIENASDITKGAFYSVPGFGPAMTSKLLSWRQSVERKFVFNASLGTDPTSIRQVRDEISRRRMEIEQALTRGPIELEQIRTHAITARGRPTQQLLEAWRALKQAELDLT